MFSNKKDSELISLLKMGNLSEQEKIDILETIGKNKIKGAIEWLIELLKDKSSDVRTLSAKALGEIGDSRAFEPLIRRIINDESGMVRGWSAWALGEIGDQRAVLPLIAMLESEKYIDGITGAVDALGKLGDSRALSPLCQALDRYMKSDTHDFKIPLFITQALGDLGDERAIPILLHLQDAYDGTYSPVEKTISIALKKLGYR